MGADILLYALPHCELTDERRDKITKAVEAVSDKDVLDYNEDYLHMELPDLGDMDMAYGEGAELEAMATLVRADILDACFEVLEHVDNPRDMASISFPGLGYRVLMTGGMSWGDNPTESSNYLDKLSNFDPLWDLLQKFAEEDCPWQ
jgi:hypothetical protein